MAIGEMLLFVNNNPKEALNDQIERKFNELYDRFKYVASDIILHVVTNEMNCFSFTDAVLFEKTMIHGGTLQVKLLKEHGFKTVVYAYVNDVVVLKLKGTFEGSSFAKSFNFKKGDKIKIRVSGEETQTPGKINSITLEGMMGLSEF